MEDLERFCRIFVETTPDAIVYADATGVIRLWNRGAERIFGWSAAEAVGRSLDIIIPENLRASHWDGYRKTMASGASRYGDGEILAVPALRKNGKRVSIEFTIVPFRGADGRMEGIAAMMRDVTVRFEEMKTLRRRLVEMGGPARRSE